MLKMCDKFSCMNKDYTHISMVIDRSGSMSTCWSDVTGGYKELVKTNKEVAGKCTLFVAAFDSQYTVLEDFSDISEVDENLSTYPRGSTALLDAIGKTITTVGNRLSKLAEEERPAKVILFINTDGFENCSTEYSKDAIKKLIEEHTNVWKWQIQFLGADLASVNEARDLGITIGNTSTYDTSNSLQTYKLVGEKFSKMRTASTYEDYSACASFTDDDKTFLNSQ